MSYDPTEKSTLVFAVPSTHSRLHGLCLCLLQGTATPDWIVASGLPDCTLLSVKIHTATKQFVHCCTQRGVAKPLLDCHRAVLQIMTLPLQLCASPQITQITLPQLCPGLCRHLAPTLSHTSRGCAEDSLPALKGLLSFALAVQYSLTSLRSLR